MNIFLSKPSKTILDIRDYTGIPVYIKRRLPYRINTVIRWGSTRPILGEVNKIYNTANAIQTVSNKAYCRRKLAEAGIPVPATGSDIFPCIGRTRYHTGGKGFWFCQTPWEVERAKMEGADYFSHFYPKTKEYRIHIGKNLEGEYKVILYSGKIGDRFGSVIWNHDNGFEFKHTQRGGRRLDIIDLAKQAIEVVGLDFGAVDILSNPLYPQFPPAVICEINSTPALSPLGVKKYSEYFMRLLNEN